MLQLKKAVPQPILFRRHLRRNSMLRVALGHLVQSLHNPHPYRVYGRQLSELIRFGLKLQHTRSSALP